MENKKRNIANAQLSENELENVTGGMDIMDDNWPPVPSDPAPISAGDHTIQPPFLGLIPIPYIGINDVDITFDMEVITRKP